MADTQAPIVIFDGVCTLCNTSVDFIIRHDRSGRVRFCAFQSAAGRMLLERHGITTAPDTIYVVDGGHLYDRSDAVLRLARWLRWPWRVAVAGHVLPRPLRDALYAVVAKNRYRWFGEKETCRIPTAEERARFVE